MLANVAGSFVGVATLACWAGVLTTVSDDLAMDGATRMRLVVRMLLLLSALGVACAAALAQLRWGAPRASSPTPRVPS